MPNTNRDEGGRFASTPNGGGANIDSEAHDWGDARGGDTILAATKPRVGRPSGGGGNVLPPSPGANAPRALSGLASILGHGGGGGGSPSVETPEGMSAHGADVDGAGVE